MEASPKELRVDSNGWHLVNQGTRIFFRVKPQRKIKSSNNGMKQSVARNRELFPADTKVYRPKVLWCKRRNVATESEKWGAYFLSSSNIRRCMTKEESGYEVLIYIYRFLQGKCWRTIFTHEFVFTKRTSEALRASEFRENKRVRKYCTKALSMMKFVYYIQTEIFLKLKMIYLNRFYKYPCSFESFLNNLNLNLQKS